MHETFSNRKLTALILCSLLAIACTSGSVSCSEALAQNFSTTPVAEQVLVLSEIPLMPAHGTIKRKPETCEIYQLDSEPLGARKPLLMIHGGHGEDRPFFRWNHLIAYLQKDERFARSFKVYLLRYNSNQYLERTVPQAEATIIALARATGKPLCVLALSMGGNVAQLAMENKDVENSIDFVLAMATPFHGSPLFSSDWFEYSLYKSHTFPGIRILDSIDYRLYFSLHHTWQHDLKWDDVDDLIPRVGYFRSKIPLGPRGYLTPVRDMSEMLTRAGEPGVVDKKKFIAYGAYLLNPYVMTSNEHRWEHSLVGQFHSISAHMRAQLGREQAALMVLNRQISKVDAGPGGSILGRGAHVYALNDGITPVMSALWLPVDACRSRLLLSEDDVPPLASAIDVASARVFRNINHVTFVEGAPPHHGSKNVRDQMHPEETPRPIFQWIAEDLFQAAGANLETAQESEGNGTSKDTGKDTGKDTSRSPG